MPASRGLAGAAPVAAFLLGLSLFPPCAAGAEPTPLDGRVVWTREDRVYIAVSGPDSVEPGARLTFELRGRDVATGDVTRIVDRELMIVRLTSGALPEGRRLEQVRIRIERPGFVPPRALRLGFPSRGRRNLLFGCERVTIASPAPQAYRTERLSERSFRLVRDSAGVGTVPWPDTLFVRLFDEAADEEIAVERRELDVAVFWPGELSTYMRANPLWVGDRYGTRSRGVVTATAAGAASAYAVALTTSDSLLLAALNHELFRDDLDWTASTSHGPGTTRFQVDPALRGVRTLERFLARAGAAPPGTAPVRTARLAYADAERGAAPGTALFAIRCAVVCDPKLRPYVSALGNDALVDMLVCPPARARP